MFLAEQISTLRWIFLATRFAYLVIIRHLLHISAVLEQSQKGLEKLVKRELSFKAVLLSIKSLLNTSQFYLPSEHVFPQLPTTAAGEDRDCLPSPGAAPAQVPKGQSKHPPTHGATCPLHLPATSCALGRQPGVQRPHPSRGQVHQRGQRRTTSGLPDLLPEGPSCALEGGAAGRSALWAQCLSTRDSWVAAYTFLRPKCLFQKKRQILKSLQLDNEQMRGRKGGTLTPKKSDLTPVTFCFVCFPNNT